MKTEAEMPDVYCQIVGINKQASGAVLVLDCKHQVPAMPYRDYRFGDRHLCHRCGAKAMSALLAKARPDTDT